MITAEQVVATQKANLQSAYGMTQQAFAGVEKLVELNLTAARATLAESAEHAKAVLAAKDPQEFFALQAALFQPIAEKAAAYNRHVYNIATGTASGLQKSIEAKLVEGQQAVHGMVEATVKNAPAGSEPAMAMLKQAMSASQNAYESVQKAVKQATEVAESNLNAVTETAVKAVKTASKKR